MLNDEYQQLKRTAANGGFRIRLAVTTAGTTQDVKAPKVTGLTLAVQKVKVIVVTGSAGKTFQLRAKTTTAQVLTAPLDMGTAGVTFAFDFGPDGFVLPAGETLEGVISAAGAAFKVIGEGYYA